MSIQIMDRLFWADLPAHLKLTALIIANAANDEGYGYPGQERIALQLRRSTRTVRNNIEKLIAHGTLTKEPRGKPGGGRNSNAYQFNLDALPHPRYRVNRKSASDIGDQTGNELPTKIGKLEQANRKPKVRKPEKVSSAEPLENRQNEALTLPMSASRASACPHTKIIALYHEVLPDLPGIIASRWPRSQGEKDLAARWREDARHQALGFWRWFFEIVHANPHWCGNNDRNWKADLRWLVKRTNFDKVLEYGVNHGVQRGLRND